MRRNLLSGLVFLTVGETEPPSTSSPLLDDYGIDTPRLGAELTLNSKEHYATHSSVPRDVSATMLLVRLWSYGGSRLVKVRASTMFNKL